MKSLLSNAALSIQLGVDYKSPDPKRVLSAVRNITAGVLLLFKEKLRQLSPDDSDEVLLKQRISPKLSSEQTVQFRGTGKKTVDTQEIKDRFISLGIVVDWARVDAIVSLRNNIEHYFTGEPESRMREMISSTFIIVRDFCSFHLRIEPAELLGTSTWEHLLDIAEVYEREAHECRAQRETLDWGSGRTIALSDHVRCKHCSSELIKPVNDGGTVFRDATFLCVSCHNESEFHEIAEDAVNDCYGAEAHLAIKDGGDAPSDYCPECGLDTLFTDDDVRAACDYERQYDECAVCSTHLSAQEQQFGGLCAYHNHIMNKDD